MLAVANKIVLAEGLLHNLYVCYRCIITNPDLTDNVRRSGVRLKTMKEWRCQGWDPREKILFSVEVCFMSKKR